MVRGGSWINDGRNCRSAYRNANEPGNRNDNLGFRVCLARSPNIRPGAGKVMAGPLVFLSAATAAANRVGMPQLVAGWMARSNVAASRFFETAA
ncbi:MAG: hypothetical protein J5I93_15485 [Pirellulaceae bacterium]|nr:hypothetical protein [Pirellulaceae bacterium]